MSVASGTGPDLAVAHTERIAGFARQGALLEFRPTVIERLGIKGDDFIPALWEAGEVNGRRYAVPIDAFPRHIFYNKKLFAQAGLDPEKPPHDLEELTIAAQRVADRDKDVWGLWFALDGASPTRDFLAIYFQFADDLLSPDGRGVSAEFRRRPSESSRSKRAFPDSSVWTPTQPVAFETIMATEKAGIAFSRSPTSKLSKTRQVSNLGQRPSRKSGPVLRH